MLKVRYYTLFLLCFATIIGCATNVHVPSNEVLELFQGSECRISNPMILGEKLNYSQDCTEDILVKELTLLRTEQTIKVKRTFYQCPDLVKIPHNYGLLVPGDCIIIEPSGKAILHDGYYIPSGTDVRGVKIACKRKNRVEIQAVPIVNLKSDYTITFLSNGSLENAIIRCEGLSVKAPKKQVFANVVLVGSLTNNAILTEWFGCNPQNTAQGNTNALRNYIIPSAIACSTDILHASKGSYQILGHYPVNNQLWDTDHAVIRDFRGITIKGTGRKTIIMEYMTHPIRPSDVFNIVDSKNLNIRNLSVTHQMTVGDIKNGSNAFSLIHNVENIEISDCNVYDMPYVIGKSYPDGGKAFTIQAAANTNQKNILFANNTADNVSYGVDYTKTKVAEGDILESILFMNNTISNAIVGAIVHEWDSPFENNTNPVVVNGNTFRNCQVGVLCQTTKSCVITNNEITNTKRPISLYYYDGVYGIHTLGAYNTTIEGNNINMKDCDAFVNVGVYSYYPRFNGSVKNMSVRNNSIKGKSKGKTVRVGKDQMTKEEAKMLEGIIIENNRL